MLPLVVVIATGLMLGVRHALDPDHVVAVSTIIARHRALRHALAIGAVWGLGHTITILLVGGAIIAFKISIPPRLGLGMEMAVAAMLVVLGVVNLFQGPRPVGGQLPLTRPLIVGLVHGLAGSAAVALLVLTIIPDPAWGIAYLVVFGVGTMLGMMLVTAAMAWPLRLGGARVAAMHRTLGYAAGVVSLGFGLFLIHQIGFTDGLFLAAPTWTPH